MPQIVGFGLAFGQHRDLPLPPTPFGGHRPALQCRLVGDAVQPAADHLSRRNGSGLADEDKECGLEGVVGVVVVSQQPAAHAQDHRPMPAHQGFKGRFVPPFDEMI
jgi:hypothetical protein